MTLTPFWHRRICEAVAVICAMIIVVFAWSTATGINQQVSIFHIGPLAAGIGVVGIIMAVVSYFFAPESHRNSTVYAAYWLLIAAVSVLVLQTGGANSPFIALWLVATLFAGIFGRTALAILFAAVNVYLVVAIATGARTGEILLGVILAGELPILVSYILWHSKSSSEETKDRAYHDLANELNQVSGKSEAVINAISDGVIAINNKGVIELINPAAQRIAGWGHQDALNLDYKSVLQLLTADSHEVDKSTDPVFSVLTTNQPVRKNDLLLQTSSGKKIAVEVIVSPIGRLGSGAIIVFRDITKEQAEEKAQAEFISTASHEMRTPVASIEGYLGLALNPATATIDAKAHEFITKAHESAQHLGRLFQDLLDVTKADDGRLSNNPKVIDISDFTNTIVEGLKPKADEKKLRLFLRPVARDEGTMRNIDPVYYVNLDPDHLREVFANLVENAIKYTPSGDVSIDVHGDDSHVVVSFADSGIGIPTEDIPHLFQKFYRVDNTDTREIGGTGLGLYLCRRLVEAMGGRIWVESEYKKGSTFFVELPRTPHEEAQRLIEMASESTFTPTDVKNYTNDNDKESSDHMTDDQRTQALSTPIILNHRVDEKTGLQPVAAVVTPPTPATPPVTVDPLVGSTAAAAPVVEPLRPRNPMVLPPSMQAVKAEVQTAAAPAPVPAPVQAPPVAARPVAVPKRQ